MQVYKGGVIGVAQNGEYRVYGQINQQQITETWHSSISIVISIQEDLGIAPYATPEDEDRV